MDTTEIMVGRSEMGGLNEAGRLEGKVEQAGAQNIIMDKSPPTV